MIQDHVLFIDGEAIVLDKPAGLPVDPPRDGSISLENHLGNLTFGFQRWPTPDSFRALGFAGGQPQDDLGDDAD